MENIEDLVSKVSLFFSSHNNFQKVVTNLPCLFVELCIISYTCKDPCLFIIKPSVY